MKRRITFLLCIIFIISLTACANQTAVGEIDATVDTPVTEAPTAEAPQTESTEPAEPETEPEPAFDTNWAGEEYEMSFPAPPFAYEVTADDDDTMISLTIKSTNGGKEGDVTHENILAYCEALKNAGFTKDLHEGEIGERYDRTCYEFYAYDEAGSLVSLIDDGGGVLIMATIIK